jgi:hypothetical protein
MKQVEIIDEDAVQYAPSSKFLSKEEMITVNPNWIWHRKSFIFKHKIPHIVDSNIAKMMVDKYPTVIYVDTKQDLINVKYQKLKKMAANKGIPWANTFVKKDELIRMINSA